MNLEKKIVINATYLVQTHCEEWVEGQIYAKRLNESTNQYEYFVHYKQFDRRFDEWVLIDRINLNTFKDPYEDPEITLIKSEINNLESSEIRLTRDLRKRRQNIINIPNVKKSPQGSFETPEKEFKEFTKIKYITNVQIGKYISNTWYYSPYPNAYGKLSFIYICPICFLYFKSKSALLNHMETNGVKEIPNGKLRYSENNLRLYELNGENDKLSCQCLCLLAKMFIDQKTVYYDVDSFLFYTLFEVTPHQISYKNNRKKGQNSLDVKENDYQFVGYFSKEKESEENNNLACIVVLPPFQGKGYGTFLVQISYELSKLKGNLGQPEKPLSFMGHRSYSWYWRWKILDIFQNKLSFSCPVVGTKKNRKRLANADLMNPIVPASKNVSIQYLCQETGMCKEDVLQTLDDLDLLNTWLNDGHTVVVSSSKIHSLIKDKAIYRYPLIKFNPEKLIELL